MNPFQKQLVLSDGRTLVEHYADDVSEETLDQGPGRPLPARPVSVEEFERDMADVRRDLAVAD